MRTIEDVEVAKRPRALVAMLDIDAISDDIEMARRSGEMAKHVALDHGPELIAEIRRLRWQVRHGDGDHMCDECWPAEPND